MSKIKRSYVKLQEECPVRFCWGTVCEQIWHRGVPKTLVDIRASCSGVVAVEKGERQDVIVDLGRCELFCLLERADGIEGPIDMDLRISTNIHGGEDAFAKVRMEPRHIHFYHTAQLEGLPVHVPKDVDHLKTTYVFRYFWREQEIGSIPLRIDVKVEQK